MEKRWELFQLNDTQKVLVIDYGIPCKWNCDFQMPLVLHMNGREILLSETSFFENMVSLKEHLELASAHKLIRTKQIKNDLGYLYTVYWYQEKDNNNFDHWNNITRLLMPYMLWSSPESITWMYTSNDSIILTCTPYYDAQRDGKFAHWIGQYEPYFSSIISPKKAAELYAISQKFVEHINAILEGKASVHTNDQTIAYMNKWVLSEAQLEALAHQNAAQ